jgi:hypothetical protein
MTRLINIDNGGTLGEGIAAAAVSPSDLLC